MCADYDQFVYSAIKNTFVKTKLEKNELYFHFAFSPSCSGLDLPFTPVRSFILALISEGVSVLLCLSDENLFFKRDMLTSYRL